jgi:hypothetical protein
MGEKTQEKEASGKKKEVFLPEDSGRVQNRP